MTNTRPTRFPRGLYGITPDWHDTGRLLAAIDQAASGGLKALQWRRKSGDEKSRWAQAAAVRERCRQLGVVFIVNDNIETALRLDADGVHLGRDDGPLNQARQALGAGRILGASCYNEAQLAAQALVHDVDYIAFGTVYPSRIKPDAVHATLDHIRQGLALAQQHQPDDPARAAVVAIGGITANNAAAVIDAGADSIALISGLFEAPDIQAEAARCAALFQPR